MHNEENMDIEQLFRSHYRALCVYAIHYVGDEAVAEDVVMDCFVRFAEKADAGENILSPKSYLYRMTRNACLDWLRRNAGIASVSDTLPDCPDADDELRQRSEREARLWNEVDRLPEACRRVLLMSKRDGMKNSEIASALGISVKTVEARITKAYAALRRRAEAIYCMLLLQL